MLLAVEEKMSGEHQCYKREGYSGGNARDEKNHFGSGPEIHPSGN